MQVNYTVNALGQTTQASIGVPAQGTNTVVASNASYYPNGGLKQFTYGNGIVHTMTQNARQLPGRSTDGTVLDLGVSFDPNGNVAGVTDYTSAARQTKTMVYDSLDRLTSATSPMFGTASYTYDPLDNLKTVVVPGRNHTYVYNPTTNQLSNVTNTVGGASVIGLAYDVQGNLANKNGVATTFDYGNRLRGTLGLAYRYDALSRRVRQDTAGAQLKYSHYVQDGRLVWQRDEPAGKRISNVYLAGSLVAEFNRPIGSTTETLTYLHTDALGSPIAKTNAVGSLIETSEYEPYGKLLNRANDDRAGYTGHVMDAGTGLTYMQQRYYDPAIGRFLSVDPVSADTVTGWNFNRYNYAANNPYKFKDPDGRIIDTIADVGFIVYDIYDISKNGLSWTSGGALAADVVGAVVPFATGLGTAVRTGAHGADALKGADKAVDAATGTAGGARAGKPMTPAGRQEVIDGNRSANGGTTQCAGCKQETTPSQQSQKGVSTPGNETRVDHIIPQSKGGDGSPSNGQVLCSSCNLDKGNKTDWVPPKDR